MCHDQGVHPCAEVPGAASVARKGFLDGCQTPVVAGVAATLGFVVQRIDEWRVTVREGAPDRFLDMEAINVVVVVIVMERSVPLLQLPGGEPMAQELDEEAEVSGVVVLDLDADRASVALRACRRTVVTAGARVRADEPGVLRVRRICLARFVATSGRASLCPSR